ncbi:MAG: DUF5123 domain-containing protein [Chitinophagaceae bacterium]|nr:DUF5123 domain-containing protein [Chitinophagaceae bacterium]
MKSVYNKILRTISMMVAIVAIFAGCTKTEDDPVLPRQFKPGDIVVQAGETQAVLQWGRSQLAEPGTTYRLEVSTDTNFAAAAPIAVELEGNTYTLTESELEVEVKYFARVRANAINATEQSGWVHSNGFRITGEQIFLTIQDVEVKDKSVTLRWRPSAGLTKIVLTPGGGTAEDITLTADDLNANLKVIDGLTPLTTYTATIWAGAVRKGITTFTTKEPSIYTTVLTPADDLVAAVAAAQDGDMIGLEPGTYDCLDGVGAYASLVIRQKSIVIASVSGNPNDTKVNYREVTLKGTGAGVKLVGIGFDGLAAGSNSLYFLNLVGDGSDAEAANFKNIEVNNCIVTNMGNCFFRGNRAANNAHTIDTIRVVNSIVADSRYLSAYTFFTMEKLEFESLELINSTFNRLGRAFIGYSTNITVPVVPRIIIDHCTINSFGRDGRNNFFIDNNTNQATVTVTNSIIANTPMSGQTTGTALIRGGNTTGLMANNNSFNLSDGAATPTELTWPSLLTLSSNTTINLGWTDATNDFTLPAGSPLRTGSTTGGVVGDPRWGL